MSQTDRQLLSRITCPHCWTRFPPYETKWVSSHPELNDDLKVREGQRRFLPSRFDPVGRALDVRGEPCHALACPHCHLTYPRDLLELPTTFLSIVGAPGSGKSYFLTSSMWSLRRSLASQFLVSFEDADPDANLKLQDYEQRLFFNDNPRGLVALPKTELDGDLYEQVELTPDRPVVFPRPFVFRLRMVESHPMYETMSRRGASLCLYDNAGEHFLPGQDSPNSPGTKHLALSKALLFIFDPTQHPRVRQALEGRTEDPQVTEALMTHRQDQVLSEAAKRIRSELAIPQDQRDGRPLIVVVGKSDIWKSLVKEAELQPPALRQTRSAIYALDVPVIRRTSTLVRNLFSRLAPEFVSAAEAFSDDVTFIPVSALGTSPVEMDSSGSTGSSKLLGVRPDLIHPVWIEIPLLYALHRTIPALIPAVRPRA